MTAAMFTTKQSDRDAQVSKLNIRVKTTDLKIAHVWLQPVCDAQVFKLK